MRRILLWGATGFTGRLVATALAGLDLPVTLAGRDSVRLRALRAELSEDGAWGIEAADASRPQSVATLVDEGTVVLATVGPFKHLGWPAGRAAAHSGAAYLDCTGEPAFSRRVFDELAVPAVRSGAVLAPAFGFDYVPGQVAAAHALREAPGARAVRVGYFTVGRVGVRSASRGTLASMAAIAGDPSYAWQNGRLQRQRVAAHTATMRVGGRARTGISVGGAEHLFLPRTFLGLSDVNVYLGVAGSKARWVQAGSAGFAPLAHVPGVRHLADQVTRRSVRGSAGGPSAHDRAAVSALVVAEALDDRGEILGRVELTGPNPYELTAALLATAAERLLMNRGDAPSGVVGPLELFGVDAMLSLADEVGLRKSI